jgi:hypothetical protein
MASADGFFGAPPALVAGFRFDFTRLWVSCKLSWALARRWPALPAFARFLG